MRILGAIWVAPLAIPIWLLYLLPLAVIDGGRNVRYVPGRLAFWFDIREREDVGRAGRAYRYLWRKWGPGGHAMPLAAVTYESPGSLGHELRHVDQWFAFGPLFPFAYLAGLAIGAARGSPHLWSPLEVDAREHGDHW